MKGRMPSLATLAPFLSETNIVSKLRRGLGKKIGLGRKPGTKVASEKPEANANSAGRGENAVTAAAPAQA
jgi:hypothetical protein